jgi:DNA-binding NarL/FixJ family response regulator
MSRVLVIDREPVVQKLVAEILAGAGHEAFTAASPEQATELLAREPVDLVLGDEDAVRQLRDAHGRPAVPLARPFSASEILSAVAAALGTRTTRVLVAEDHPAVRASLVAYLDAYADITVVAEAENGWEAVKLARQEVPDFVLMDIRMPVMDGIEGTRMIKGLRPETRVVLLSAYEQDELIESGLEAGAEGFLLKGASGAELVAAVREGL